MRTTLDIEDDVLLAAKELAAREGTTAGRILSEYFRRAHRQSPEGGAKPRPSRGYLLKNGIPVVPSRGEVVTSTQVERIREQEGL